jgi:DNA polymerase III subunit epsilon
LPVDFQIIEYYLYKQFIQKFKIKQAMLHSSYSYLNQALLRYRQPIMNQNHFLSNEFTIFDLETTGFFPDLGDEILSIGAIKIKQGDIQYDDTFYKVIKPIHSVSKDTKKLTGLTSEDLAKGTPLPYAMQEFISYCEGSILVAHPASFDIGFLRKVLQKWKLPLFDTLFIDSFLIANSLYPDEKNFLDQLVTRFQIPQRPRHHALFDSIMTAEIFIRLLKDLEQEQFAQFLQSTTN